VNQHHAQTFFTDVTGGSVYGERRKAVSEAFLDLRVGRSGFPKRHREVREKEFLRAPTAQGLVDA